MTADREEFVALEQIRLRFILRIAVSDMIDKMEDARVRSDLTPAEARVALASAPGIPQDVLSYIAGLYSERYEEE
jgi:hypothetical protein